MTPPTAHPHADLGDLAERPALPVDTNYLQDVMLRLLLIHSPTGYTDRVVHLVCEELDRLGVEHEITRRGAIRASLQGSRRTPDRAIVAHLDTIGAMVSGLKPNGRLGLSSVGTWSARFAEGARCHVFGEDGARTGTIVPLKAAGHVYNDDVDTQETGWDHVELRLDEHCHTRQDIESLGIGVGDFVGIDACPRVTPAGFVDSRHLDDKAGVAALLAAVKAVCESGETLPVDVHPLFTISEEVGSGASGVLHQDVAEMVAIDTAPQAPEQESTETHVTIAAKDSSGPFDWHLTRRLCQLAKVNTIPYVRDVFRYYHCDAAAALEAGNDIRTALVCFGTDATHGYERTHMSALEGVGRLLTAYMRTPPVVPRDAQSLGSAEGFTTQPDEDATEHPHEEAAQ